MAKSRDGGINNGCTKPKPIYMELPDKQNKEWCWPNM